MAGSASSSESSPKVPDRVSAHGVLNLAGTQVEFNLTVPTSSVRSVAVLPLLQSLWSTIEAGVVAEVESQGKRISCRPGCGACCRQLVPISRIEARHLAELVESLPEHRRRVVRHRFAEAARRLADAGMLETLRRPEIADAGDRRTFATAYFRLGIACPFLEEESCSIHTDRPLACREYLVTSPAENCANPSPENIETVPMRVRLSGALGRFAEPIAAGSANWVPLALALEWAESHPDRSPARPGPEWVMLLFQELTGKEIPAPPAAGPPGADHTAGSDPD